jgi:hypothetical protein
MLVSASGLPMRCLLYAIRSPAYFWHCPIIEVQSMANVERRTRS